MLEFYQAYATYEDLMAFIEGLLRGIDAPWPQRCRTPTPVEERSPVHPERALCSRLDGPRRRRRRREDRDPWLGRGGRGRRRPGARRPHRSRLVENPGSSRSGPRRRPARKAIDWGNFRKGLSQCDNDGERLFACYEYVAEPFLPDDYRDEGGQLSVPVFIQDYPFEVSPLARRSDANPSSPTASSSSFTGESSATRSAS